MRRALGTDHRLPNTPLSSLLTREQAQSLALASFAWAVCCGDSFGAFSDQRPICDHITKTKISTIPAKTQPTTFQTMASE